MSTCLYPARIKREDDWHLVRFRDFPEALTSGHDEAEALRHAADCLSEALAGRLRRGDPIPNPRAARKGEVLVAPEPAVALKLALHRVTGGERGTAARIAKGLGVDHKEARRILDPAHRTQPDRLADALALFGYGSAFGVFKFDEDCEVTVTTRRRPRAA